MRPPREPARTRSAAQPGHRRARARRPVRQPAPLPSGAASPRWAANRSCTWRSMRSRASDGVPKRTRSISQPLAATVIAATAASPTTRCHGVPATAISVAGRRRLGGRRRVGLDRGNRRPGLVRRLRRGAGSAAGRNRLRRFRQRRRRRVRRCKERRIDPATPRPAPAARGSGSNGGGGKPRLPRGGPLPAASPAMRPSAVSTTRRVPLSGRPGIRNGRAASSPGAL